MLKPSLAVLVSAGLACSSFADELHVPSQYPTIQAAIDAASVAGGRVDLPAGTYRIDGTLVVTASDVALVGVGPDTQLRFTRLEGMTNQGHLTFRGQRTYGPDLPLAADGADRGHDVLVDRPADSGDLQHHLDAGALYR